MYHKAEKVIMKLEANEELSDRQLNKLCNLACSKNIEVKGAKRKERLRIF